MDHLNAGLTIAQIIVLIASFFNPALSRSVERAIKVVSSLHALYEQEKAAHKETQLRLKALEVEHEKCQEKQYDIIT